MCWIICVTNYPNWNSSVYSSFYRQLGRNKSQYESLVCVLNPLYTIYAVSDSRTSKYRDHAD